MLSSGCLGLWTLHTSQPWDTWSWCRVEMQPLFCPLSRPNTTIFSDEWSAYNRVQQLPNVINHETVNHSLHFVDPTTGVHTQNVESYWNRVKGKFKRMKGVHLHQLPSYLEAVSSGRCVADHAHPPHVTSGAPPTRL